MKKIITFLAFSVAVAAQTPASPNYTATDVFSSSSGETVTVQIAANSPKSVVGGNISGSVSAAATICFFWNGAAVSSTQAAVQASPGSPQGVANFYTSSSTSGAIAGPCFTLASGPFNFNGGPNFYLWKNGSPPWNPPASAKVQNFTVTLTPATGTITGQLNLNYGEN